MSANLQNVSGRDYLAIPNERSLGSVDVGHDHWVSCDGSGESRRQNRLHRPQFAAQRELTVQFTSCQLGTGVDQLTGSNEDPDGDREVESTAFLGQVGGRQVDRDAPRRKLEIGVDERRPHTILALLHHDFGETDDVEGRESRADVDFDSHLRCIDSALLSAEYGGDGHPLPHGLLIVFSRAAAALHGTSCSTYICTCARCTSSSRSARRIDESKQSYVSLH